MDLDANGRRFLRIAIGNLRMSIHLYTEYTWQRPYKVLRPNAMSAQ